MPLAWTLWGSCVPILGNVSRFICVYAQFTLDLPGFPRCSKTPRVWCEAKVRDFFSLSCLCVTCEHWGLYLLTFGSYQLGDMLLSVHRLKRCSSSHLWRTITEVIFTHIGVLLEYNLDSCLFYLFFSDAFVLCLPLIKCEVLLFRLSLAKVILAGVKTLL